MTASNPSVFCICKLSFFLLPYFSELYFPYLFTYLIHSIKQPCVWVARCQIHFSFTDSPFPLTLTGLMHVLPLDQSSSDPSVCTKAVIPVLQWVPQGGRLPSDLLYSWTRAVNIEVEFPCKWRGRRPTLVSKTQGTEEEGSQWEPCARAGVMPSLGPSEPL